MTALGAAGTCLHGQGRGAIREKNQKKNKNNNNTDFLKQP